MATMSLRYSKPAISKTVAFGNVVLVLMLWTAHAMAIEVRPLQVTLRQPESSQQLLVLETADDGTTTDLTRVVDYRVMAPAIVSVGAGGQVTPRSDGNTQIMIQHATGQQTVNVAVTGISDPPPISFAGQIAPLLGKLGCNAGQCHAKAEGQAGFKLSVFAAEPEADHHAIARQGMGRRVLPTSAEKSLILLKASAQIPHGGGQRLTTDSIHYRRLHRWISQGARADADPGARWTGIEVDPAVSILSGGKAQQLRVTAIAADGTRTCITQDAVFDASTTTIANVDDHGLVQTTGIAGEVAILVKYLDHVAVARLTAPQQGGNFVRPPEQNFVDQHVWNKLQQLNISASKLSQDGPFLRRLYLDTIGTLPTNDEVRQFLADQDTQKRIKAINSVLQRPEYADFWALLWSDLLRVDRRKMDATGSVAMTRWLRRQFLENRPYDEFVRQLLTVEGSMTSESPAPFYKSIDSPEILGRSISQLFLGVRIECAQCHHHPFEKWTQADYYGLGGFFTGITKKGVPGVGEVLVAKGGGDLPHPKTKEPVPTRALGAPPEDITQVIDRRSKLADWMTSPENPFFARMISNRLWAHYFGRGLVEPIDDVRETNPATNEPLLDALADHMIELNYDLKAFTRTLLQSHVYQLSAQSNESNARDQQNFSHCTPKPMAAEVLLDAICQVTDVGEKFNGWPEGFRAIQVWDSQIPSYFLKLFGRPLRNSVCSCERSTQPSISQALHLVNSPEINHKIHSHQGRARKLATSDLTPQALIDELFLVSLSRFPSIDEQNLFLEAFSRPSSNRQAAVEDILWTLLNSKEFIYIH